MYRALIVLCVASIAACVHAAPIELTTLPDGSTVRYPVPLVSGNLSDSSLTAVTLTNLSRPADKQVATPGSAWQGRFRVLVELVPGENRLLLRAGDQELPFTLNYQPQTNRYYVRMVCFTDNTGETRFQTPIPNDPQDFRGKFDAALKLQQTFTAESMSNHGYGRRTFNLETDADGKVITHIVRGDLPASEYHRRGGDFVYGAAADAISKQIPDPYAINLVVAPFVIRDPVTGGALGHAALGGGNQAYFGGGSLYTWPDSIAQADAACNDASLTDTTKFLTDSIGRNSYWANSSTCIGACLHELGHAFGLPHSDDYNGIMVRGIDNFTRMFVFRDPPSAWRNDFTDYTDDQIGHWETVSAAALRWSRWYAMDDRQWDDEPQTRVSLDAAHAAVTFSSPLGIGFVGLEKPGSQSYFAPLEELNTAQPALTVPLALVGRKVASQDVVARIIDAQGNRVDVRLRDLLTSPVTAWQVSPLTAAWTNTDTFVPVSPERPAQIAASFEGQPVRPLGSTSADLRATQPADQREMIAGYLGRTLHCDAARRVRILTGSDDCLRLWVNGQLVQQVLEFRGARSDSEQVDVDLPAGDSRIIAEITNGMGGWELCLRFTDEAGAALQLSDDGRLSPAGVPALGALLDGPFIRTWHFSPLTDKWSGSGTAPEVSPERLAEITRTALERPVVTSTKPAIDFPAQFPGVEARSIAGYAARRFTCAQAMPVKLYTGSDDGLRVWLNGKLVREVLRPRSLKIDAEMTELELPAGESTLVMEVLQGGGDWQLAARLENATGEDLLLTDDNRLVSAASLAAAP